MALRSPSLRMRIGPWWRLKQRIHNRLIKRLWCDNSSGIVLKTDLFDEASGPFHFAGDFAGAPRFLGIDVDFEIVRKARQQLRSNLEHPLCLAADVRALPFAESSLCGVLSISTLDHFENRSSIAHALSEIYRVLMDGGKVLVTLDNPNNPEVLLRRKLPASIVERLRADSFPLGMTLDAGEVRNLMSEIGFQVEEMHFLIHAWRYPVIRLLDYLDRWLPNWMVEGILRYLEWLELLDRLPTRSISGHYGAWVAHK